jgi:hypothetical protein
MDQWRASLRQMRHTERLVGVVIWRPHQSIKTCPFALGLDGQVRHCDRGDSQWARLGRPLSRQAARNPAAAANDACGHAVGHAEDWGGRIQSLTGGPSVTRARFGDSGSDQVSGSGPLRKTEFIISETISR